MYTQKSVINCQKCNSLLTPVQVYHCADVVDALLLNDYRAGNLHLCRQDAADVNDDGQVDSKDLQTLLGGGVIPPPTGTPGQDPTPDGLY